MTATTSSNAPAPRKRVLLLRFLFTVVLLGVVLIVQWPAGPPPDFQVWVAADAIADAGGNPYKTDALNTELRSDPAYGDVWQGGDQFRVRFFNPPTWLAMLQVVAFSPAAMSAVGLVLLAAAIVMLSQGSDDRTFAGYVLATAVLLLSPFAQSTLQFGQSGMVIAGLIAMRIALAGRVVEGVPMALLSFKPHIAFASALPALMKHPARTFTRLVPPALLVLLLTAVVYGPSIFLDWVDAFLNESDGIVPVDDMTLRTLSTRWPLPASLNMITLLMALVGVAWIAKRSVGVNPATLVLFSVAVTVFLSGHGFAHDWLWIALIPVVHRWDVLRSILGMFAVVVINSFTYAVNFTPPLPVVSSPSVVGLLVIGYLGFEVYRQSPLRSAR